MKCPSCKKEGLKYLKKRPVFAKKEDYKNYKRQDFSVRCSKCKYEGFN